MEMKQRGNQSWLDNLAIEIFQTNALQYNLMFF